MSWFRPTDPAVSNASSGALESKPRAHWLDFGVLLGLMLALMFSLMSVVKNNLTETEIRTATESASGAVMDSKLMDGTLYVPALVPRRGEANRAVSGKSDAGSGFHLIPGMRPTLESRKRSPDEANKPDPVNAMPVKATQVDDSTI